MPCYGAVSLPSCYELGPRIGQGGTADVFRARSLEGLARTVVIKRIRADLQRSPEIAAMLAAEAQIVRRLQHGGIAQLLDFGIDDGAPYLVLEHINGVSLDALRSYLRACGGDLPIADALCVVEQVASALGYAHRLREDDGVPLGLVHRDVTPRNILVSCEGIVKLTDFGLARVGRPNAPTMPGVVKGTFGYMSPEQARGAPIDGRSDQFSLGVVLYELLSGANPLGEATTLATALRLLGRPLPRLPAHVDPALAAIVARATAIDPRQRFQAIGEFGAALEQWRADRRVCLSPEALAIAVRRARGEDAATVRRLDDALAPREREGATIIAAHRAPRRTPLVVAGLGLLVAALVAIWIAPGHASTPAEAAAPPAPPAAAISPPTPPIATSPIATAPIVAPPSHRSTPAGGRLKINLLPWAQVQLDGRAIGNTPIDVPLAAGAHTVVLVNPDTARRKEYRIDVRSNRSAEIKTW